MKKLLILTLLSTCAPAHANDIPPAQMVMLGRSMLCDTQEQLHQALDSELADIPAGCGMFSPEQPLPFLVTPLYWYDTPNYRVLVAQLVYSQNGWTQYGYIHFIKLDASL